MPQVATYLARRLAFCVAILIPVGPWLAGCTESKAPVTIFNPDQRRPLFARSKPKIVIGLTDPGQGVFDTADWAFIKHRAPWDPMARHLSLATGARIRFQLLTPFQIAHLFQSQRCDFALVSSAECQELIREGASARIIARAEPFRRQGILVADATSDIRSLEDLRGRPFAFGPRTDPVLFYKTLEVLDEAGISPSDLRQEIVLTGFDGSLQHHRNSRQTAREIVYGLRAQAGVIEAAVFETYPPTGGRWFPLAYTFSKDQFIELARTDPVEAITLPDALFVAAEHVDDALIRRVQEFLVAAHVRAPDALHALGFGRFSMPPMPRNSLHDSSEEMASHEPAEGGHHIETPKD
ncbi:MAG: phosphate/phosphite/phosphonate ABC transporter substrate-binding protein [Phycisphaerae bacterium]